MNKKKFFLFTIPVIVLLFGFSCCRQEENGYVFREFFWLISTNPFLKAPVAEEKDWYYVYNLNSEQIEQMLKSDYSVFNYQGWKCYKRSLSIGAEKTIHINGEKNNIMINMKKGCDSYNQIAMFIDLTEKKLILFYGITYGI